MEFGQTRMLNEKHMLNLMESLQERPPLCNLKLTVWENSAERKYYVLAGQHLAKALMKLREDREKNGLQLARWQKFVTADIMKFDTPLEDRRIIAGAQNASTRLHRTTTVAECLDRKSVV